MDRTSARIREDRDVLGGVAGWFLIALPLLLWPLVLIYHGLPGAWGFILGIPAEVIWLGIVAGFVRHLHSGK